MRLRSPNSGPNARAPGLESALGPSAGRGDKPITGGASTMALHALSIDPRTGLPRGERLPATPAAVVSLVCGTLLCLGPLTALPAIVAGVVGIRAVRREPHAVGGALSAWIGLLLGVVNLIVCALGLLLWELGWFG